MPDLKQIISKVQSAHKDQYDKSGQPYFLHVLRVTREVAQNGGDIFAITAAILHDVIEDTAYGIHDVGQWLVDAEFTGPQVAQVCSTVSTLTRRENEPYGDYIDRICNDDRAVEVKIADINDNMGRLENLAIGDTQARLLAKYLPAYNKLYGQPRLRSV